MNRFIEKGRLPLIFFLCFLLSYVVFSMLSRSVWIDEGFLLKNLIGNDSLLRFLHPLRYYDQAEPMIGSVMLEAIMRAFHQSISSMRASIFMISAVLMLPIVFMFARKGKWALVVFVLLLLANALTVGFYYTEIKHYFLEVTGSFILIAGLWKLEERQAFPLFIASICWAAATGFSTIIPAIVFTFYGAFWLIQQRRFRAISNSHIAMIFFAALVLLAAYWHMKYLTQFQISSADDIYLRKSILDDSKTLILSVVAVYGKVFLIISFIATIAAYFSDGTRFLFKLNLMFTVLIVGVVLGKLSGLYPVAYGRHIVWLVPFSIVIVALSILDFIPEMKVNWKIVGGVLLFGVLLKTADVTYHTIKGERVEGTANNQLYAYLSGIDATNILVHPLARPSLEYYRQLDSDLNKHTYFGMNSDINSDAEHLRISWERSREELLDALKDQPEGDFLIITSHLYSIEQDLPDKNDPMGTYWLKKDIKDKGCAYFILFSVKMAQVLSITCPKKHDQS